MLSRTLTALYCLGPKQLGMIVYPNPIETGRA